jgi:hypothetical protein
MSSSAELSRYPLKVNFIEKKIVFFTDNFTVRFVAKHSIDRCLSVCTSHYTKKQLLEKIAKQYEKLSNICDVCDGGFICDKICCNKNYYTTCRTACPAYAACPACSPLETEHPQNLDSTKKKNTKPMNRECKVGNNSKDPRECCYCNVCYTCIYCGENRDDYSQPGLQIPGIHFSSGNILNKRLNIQISNNNVIFTVDTGFGESLMTSIASYLCKDAFKDAAKFIPTLEYMH